MNYLLSEIAQIVGGELHGSDLRVREVATDSRSIASNEETLFAAINGKHPIVIGNEAGEIGLEGHFGHEFGKSHFLLSPFLVIFQPRLQLITCFSVLCYDKRVSCGRDFESLRRSASVHFGKLTRCRFTFRPLGKICEEFKVPQILRNVLIVKSPGR